MFSIFGFRFWISEDSVGVSRKDRVAGERRKGCTQTGSGAEADFVFGALAGHGEAGMLRAADFERAFDFLVVSDGAPDAFGVAVGQGSVPVALDPDWDAGLCRRGRNVGGGFLDTGTASTLSVHRQTLTFGGNGDVLVRAGSR